MKILKEQNILIGWIFEGQHKTNLAMCMKVIAWMAKKMDMFVSGNLYEGQYICQ